MPCSLAKGLRPRLTDMKRLSLVVRQGVVDLILVPDLGLLAPEHTAASTWRN